MNTTIKNPYVGPRTFLKEEGHLFFGREREARDLLALVVSERLVLFYAQSGAGKSSLVNTRLIPNLESKGFEVLPTGRVSGDSPDFETDNIYLFNLLRNLVQKETDPRRLAHLSLARFLSHLNVDENGYFYDEASAPIESGAEEGALWKHVLIIDQFEEIFSTHPEAWKKRESFFLQLADAMQSDPYLWIVLVMREDYIAALDPYAHFLPGGLRVRYYMQRLGRGEALKAIKNPVENLRPYADGVAEKLVDDLCRIKTQKPDGTIDTQAGQYVEPVQMQVVCYSLWENLPQEGEQITEKDLQDVGDVNQSLGKYYAGRVRSVAESKHVEERTIRQWFGKKLIAQGGIRNLVLREPNKPSGGLDDDVIQAFQSDLIRAEIRGGATWYELTHDRLVQPILESNARWFKDNLSLLEQQAALWDQGNRSDGLLFFGKELADAEEWASQHPDEVSTQEDEFLRACRKFKEKQTASRERQRNWVIAISVTVSLIMIILAAFTFSGQRSAIRAEATAQSFAFISQTAQAVAQSASEESDRQAHFARGNQLAIQSQTILGEDNQLGLLLAVEAINESSRGGETHLPQAENVLRNATERTGLGIPLYGHSSSVYEVAFDPQGHWLATAGGDSNVLLWDMTSKDPSAAPLSLNAHTRQINAIAFSRDGHWLASGSSDATIRLWNLTSPDPSANSILLEGHTGEVNTVAFSWDGHWLASGSVDATIMLWDMTSENPSTSPIILRGHTDSVLTLVFSPNGDWLASGGNDTTVRLWDLTVTDPALSNPIALTGHLGSVLSLAFSPDGHWLASGGYDTPGVIFLWDITSSDPSANPTKLSGHENYILYLAFNKNGHILASASADNTVRLWDFATQGPSGNSIQLYGHSDWVRSVAFTPDEHWLASVSDDSSLRLWDLTSENPSASSLAFTEHYNYVYSIAISPDGNWLASAGDDATPRLWDISPQSDIWKMEDNLSSYTIIGSLEEQTQSISALSFSSDGRWLAGTSNGTNIRLWNFQTGIPNETNAILESQYGPVHTTFFTDYYLFGGTDDGTLLFWDLSEGNPVQYPVWIPGLESDISVIAASSDYSLIAIPNNTNYSITLVKELNDTLSLTGYKSTINTLVISPDKHWLASGDNDGIVKLWDITAEDPSTESFLLRGHSGPILSLVFSNDGHWLASGSADSTVRIWDISNINKDLPITSAYTLSGSQGKVNALVFSPKGRWLVSAGEDGIPRLWDMFAANPAVQPITLVKNPAPITALTFNPDGILASGDTDGTVQIWGSSNEYLIAQACKAARRNLTWPEWKQYLLGIYTDEPYHKTCPDYPIHPSVVDHFFEPGDLLALRGDIEGAILKYEEAIKEFPNLQSAVPNLQTRADQKYAETLIQEGDEAAREGDLDLAIAKYSEALKFNPDALGLRETPASRAKEMVFSEILAAISNLNSAGDYEALVSGFLDSRTDYPNIIERIDDSNALYNICWWGGIFEDAEEVKDVCEEIVIRDPSNGDYHDARGLNRALLGDREGAIQDFEFSLNWYKENSSYYGEEKVAQRQDWLTALKSGQNPFDEQTIGLWRTLQQIEYSGSNEEMVEKFTEASAVYPNIVDSMSDSYVLNYICWWGSLLNHASEVKEACEKIGEVAPDYGIYIDSRGLNRALLGNFEGAIQDFEFAVIWFRMNGYEDMATEREEWLAAIRSGQNPFTPAVLETLKNE